MDKVVCFASHLIWRKSSLKWFGDVFYTLYTVGAPEDLSKAAFNTQSKHQKQASDSRFVMLLMY